MSKLLASFRSIEELLDHIPDTEARLKDLYRYLQASEQMVLTLIADVRDGILPRPVSPDAEGDLEFGLHLYWLGQPYEELEAIAGGNPAHVMSLNALRQFAPASQLSLRHLNFLSGYSFGIVAADGTLWTFGKYAQLDLGWLTALLNYAINLLDPGSIYQPYPDSAQAYRAGIGAEKDSVSIAIVGDWGCGAYGNEFGGSGPAIAVMKAVKALQPDYVVHLGDVYYCGTDDRIPLHEEQDNLLSHWDTGLTEAGTNFTLNSNHEMYGAAKGLIDVALIKGTPFAHQNKTPYFALGYNDWVLIGLDSAYFDPSNLYMDGALGSDTPQQEFVKNLGDLSGKKILVMTHHNPMSYDGDTIVQNQKAGISLWDGMQQLLGRRPDIWYWGHLHLGVSYNENSVLGKTGTVCRCVGHSAVPFGNAHGINKSNVNYYAHNPITNKSKQVQNGFAIITLKNDGSFSEIFYEVTNTGCCVVGWQSTLIHGTQTV